ncbi:hypothetical protein PGT21_018823 [Puccinia graminis f. sp. tritici]|uniref:Uncharacterized protein n=1 Tax=Puccinia graminis f. sp. tritici TaxID=56615 RepID=A0A5B0Q300_PUCGR|nr:hypothetical protein PGT21_018823 [Puccinia graminis f. sp. tritici]KAA1124624.1 hypothetical protein PGTUg99_024039 [Puccinia graminis f. sp. tritici]
MHQPPVASKSKFRPNCLRQVHLQILQPLTSTSVASAVSEKPHKVQLLWKNQLGRVRSSRKRSLGQDPLGAAVPVLQ